MFRMFRGDSVVLPGFAYNDESFVALWAITMTPTLMFCTKLSMRGSGEYYGILVLSLFRKSEKYVVLVVPLIDVW